MLLRRRKTLLKFATYEEGKGKILRSRWFPKDMKLKVDQLQVGKTFLYLNKYTVEGQLDNFLQQMAKCSGQLKATL